MQVFYFVFFVFLFVDFSYEQPSNMFSEFLPDEYDGNLEWLECRGYSEVQNQENCSSCCAVALSSALSVRECMHNKRNILFSAKHIWDCATSSANNCTTGVYFKEILENMVLQSNGRKSLVSDHCFSQHVNNNPNSSECLVLPNNCSHFLLSHSVSANELGEGLKGYNRLDNGITAARAMMTEIWINGPVVAILDVSNTDFEYFSQIQNGDIFVPDLVNWRSNPNVNFSRHCIMVYGWGRDAKTGLNFWYIKNSWGKSWGINGRARIVRGYNWVENEWEGLSTRERLCQPEEGWCINSTHFLTLKDRILTHYPLWSELFSKKTIIYEDSRLERPTNFEVLSVTFLVGTIFCIFIVSYFPNKKTEMTEINFFPLKIKIPNTFFA